MKKIFFIKLIVIILGVTLCFLNDYYIRPIVGYDRILRDIDHIIGGIIFPLCYYISLSKLYKENFHDEFSSLSPYLKLCIFWEASQFFRRGYFQWDQLLCDFIGIGISYIVFFKR